MFKWLTTRKEDRRASAGLYNAIVAQSRLPVFYTQHLVPDTITGRFEMIVLHLFLVLERLQLATGDEAQPAERFGQALNEAFVSDMDDAMRELGVADVRVGERMHQAAGAYFGRLMAYRRAMAQPPVAAGGDALAAAIARNILVDVDGAAAAAQALADYARDGARHLVGQAYASLSAGIVTFPILPEPPAASPAPSRPSKPNSTG